MNDFHIINTFCMTASEFFIRFSGVLHHQTSPACCLHFNNVRLQKNLKYTYSQIKSEKKTNS